MHYSPAIRRKETANFGTGRAGLPFKNDPTRHAFGVPALPKGEGIIRLRRVSLKEDSAGKRVSHGVAKYISDGQRPSEKEVKNEFK